MLLLGIETSCDETSVALVRDGREVRANLVASQNDLHERFGGVVPELASRAHLERLDGMVAEVMANGGAGSADIDGIAVTARPGLIGALLIGVTAAKALAWAWDKPLVDVDHIHAHAISATLGDAAVEFPATALVVSGGHTSLFHLRAAHDLEPLGGTIDDAAGEAFDKVAAILGLGYPGGPEVDRRAQRGHVGRCRFPRAMLDGQSLDFSFSGLKTAVMYHVHGAGRTSGGLARLSASDIDDICAEFSAAVVDVLAAKTMLAMSRWGTRQLLVGGGVACNSALRERLHAECAQRGASAHLTPAKYCTDNAAMIACAGYHLMKAGRRADWSLTASASAYRAHSVAK